MKFSCEKEILLGILGTASRAVTGKSSMPLLEGLLICADASTLTVTGYDMSMGIRTTTLSASCRTTSSISRRTTS